MRTCARRSKAFRGLAIGVLAGIAPWLSGCAGARAGGHRADADAMTARLGPAEDRSRFRDAAEKHAWSETDPRVFDDPAAFDRASGGAPLVESFDDVSAGIDLEWIGLDGVAFRSVHAPLVVIDEAQCRIPDGYAGLVDGWRHALVPTTGRQFLSPGGPELAPGPDPAREDDDLVIVFDPPVAAVGFDLLAMSLDGMSFTDVVVLDPTGAVLYAGGIPIPARPASSTGFPPAGAAFWGFVERACLIREVRLDEHDGDAVCPDANIGLDSLRFAPAPPRRAADLDGNGRVDGADLELLERSREAWTLDADPAAHWWTGDLNRDGRIDAADVAILLSAAE